MVYVGRASGLHHAHRSTVHSLEVVLLPAPERHHEVLQLAQKLAAGPNIGLLERSEKVYYSLDCGSHEKVIRSTLQASISPATLANPRVDGCFLSQLLPPPWTHLV